MIQPISRKQRAVYDYIVDCRRQIGVSPTLSEIAEAFEIGESTARWHITCLVKAGWLTRSPGRKAGALPSVEANALKQLPAMIKLLGVLRDASESEEDFPFHALQTEARFILSRIEA